MKYTKKWIDETINDYKHLIATLENKESNIKTIWETALNTLLSVKKVMDLEESHKFINEGK